jgi:uroporphyrinogen decarboxylase
MDFAPCDRTLLWEWGYWGGAVERWYGEGLPRLKGLPKPVAFGETLSGPGAAWRSGVLNVPEAEDVSAAVGMDNGRETIPLQNFIYPPFEEEVLAEDEETVTIRDTQGVTMQKRRDAGSVPHPLAWPVGDRDDWERLKAERFQCQVDERLPPRWDQLVRQYRDRDYPLSIASGYCGFFGSLRQLMGEVKLFYAYYDQPDLLHDMASSLCDFWIEIYGQVLQQVKDVDSAEFWEDMCYKNGPMISPAMFREFMMPYYKRLIGFLRDQGVRHFCVDTDGDCRTLIPLFLECGMTGMLPFEVQAGCDVVEIRKAYPRLQIYAGLDKNLVAAGRDAIDAELEAKLPTLLRQGGYIPFVDHLVHPDVSWENFAYYRRRIQELAEQYGSGGYK